MTNQLYYTDLLDDLRDAREDWTNRLAARHADGGGLDSGVIHGLAITQLAIWAIEAVRDNQ